MVGLFLSAFGAVCGHLGRHATAGGKLRGGRLATVGLCLSYFSMLSFPVLVLIVSASFPALTMWETQRVSTQRLESQAKAESLYAVCEDFARANKGHYPLEWSQLSGRYIAGHELRKILRSPYDGGAVEAFEIVPHDRPVLAAIVDSVIVIQEISPSNEPQIAVVYANGFVKSIHNPNHE